MPDILTTGKHGPGVLSVPRAAESADPKRSPQVTGSIAPGAAAIDPRRSTHATGSIAPSAAAHGVHAAATGTRILRS